MRQSQPRQARLGPVLMAILVGRSHRHWRRCQRRRAHPRRRPRRRGPGTCRGCRSRPTWCPRRQSLPLPRGREPLGWSSWERRTWEARATRQGRANRVRHAHAVGVRPRAASPPHVRSTKAGFLQVSVQGQARIRHWSVETTSWGMIVHSQPRPGMDEGTQALVPRNIT